MIQNPKDAHSLALGMVHRFRSLSSRPNTPSNLTVAMLFQTQPTDVQHSPHFPRSRFSFFFGLSVGWRSDRHCWSPLTLLTKLGPIVVKEDRNWHKNRSDTAEKSARPPDLHIDEHL